MAKATKNFELNRKTYEKVRKMDHAQLSVWANKIYEQGGKAAISMELTPEEMKDAIVKVKGIGETKADAIIEALVNARAVKGLS